MKLNKKTIVGMVVSCALAACAYVWGPDMVQFVKETVGGIQVEAPTEAPAAVESE